MTTANTKLKSGQLCIYAAGILDDIRLHPREREVMAALSAHSGKNGWFIVRQSNLARRPLAATDEESPGGPQPK